MAAPASPATGSTALGPSPPRRSPDTWKCPYPQQAITEGVTSGAAVLRVDVDAEGHATNVTIVEDSGFGFGEEARACAARVPYLPARDADGHAVAGQTRLRILFDVR